MTQRKRKGAAAVEMAIILPFFMLLLVGFMQFAWIFLVRHSMLHAAREGARAYAVQGGSATQAEARAAQVLTEFFGGAGDFTVTSTAGPGKDRTLAVTVPITAGTVNIAGLVNVLNGLAGFIPGASGAIDTASSLNVQVNMRSEDPI